MNDLATTTGVVAIAGCAVALIALAVAATATVALRRVKQDQRAVLGDREAVDLVAHAAALDHEVRALHEYVADAATKLHQRMSAAEERLDGAVTYRALVRYDAYGEMSGHQSTSIALLDASRCGVVVSSILHRDHARLYAKQVRDGQGAEVALSPEETEAVQLALAGGGEAIHD